MDFRPHSEKQERALRSLAPIVVLGTGIQFGKTTVGALKVKMAMHTFTSPDDNFLIVAPTYKILQQSTLPAFLKVMEGMGQFNKADMTFKVAGGGTGYFRTAENPDSIVGITNVRIVWGDEAGLYTLYFWENLQARAAFKEAQIILTTSPYTLNWLYKQIILPIMRGKQLNGVDLIQAASWENPFMPASVVERARQTMDPRRFNAMFGGVWERMSGLVYDCFDETENQIQPFGLPAGTRFVGGIDWGFVEPFVFKVRAITPDGMHYGIQELYRSGMTITDICAAVGKIVTTWSVSTIYCDPSQPGAIEELNRYFRAQGIKCSATPANNDIRMGIDRHYELLKLRRLKYFVGANPHTLDEQDGYHYPAPDDLAPDQNVKEAKPVQQNDHACFLAGTMVSCPAEDKPIEAIKAGDSVWTPFGAREVISVGITGVRPVVEATFSNGRTVRSTADHPYYLAGKGFKPLDSDRYGDIVATWDEHRQKSASYSTARIIIGTVVIGVLLAGARMAASACTWLFGNTITGRCLRVFTYITAMVIDAITLFQISKFYRVMSMRLCTVKPCQSHDAKPFGSALVEFASSLKYGTRALRGEPGTASTLSGRLKTAYGAAIVDNAANPLKPRHHAANFARTIVSLLLDTRVAWTILRSRAKSALRPLLKIDTLESEPVRLTALASLLGEHAVYNLTVADVGCFYANGILVSNCDAERYISISTYLGKGRNVPFVPGEEKGHEDQFKRIERLKRGRGYRGTSEDWS